MKTLEIQFDESQEHTLGNFIRLSRTQIVELTNSPTGINPADVGARLEREDVKLCGLEVNDRYFSSRRRSFTVVTTSGESLLRFTSFQRAEYDWLAKYGILCFEATLLPDALALLSK